MKSEAEDKWSFKYLSKLKCNCYPQITGLSYAVTA